MIDIKRQLCKTYWETLKTKGEDITVAIIDSGVDKEHVNLKNTALKIKKHMNFAPVLKVCLEHFNFKDQAVFEKLLSNIKSEYVNVTKRKTSQERSTLQKNYDIVQEFINYLAGKKEIKDYDVIMKNQTLYNIDEILDKMKGVYYDNLVFSLERIKVAKYKWKKKIVVNLYKTYDYYLTKFEYNGCVYYYQEAYDGNVSMDDNGTHVASVCMGKDEGAYTGVAPFASLYDMCVKSAEKFGDIDYTMDALRWIASDGNKNIQIANISVGFKDPSKEMQVLINNVLKRGVIVVSGVGESLESGNMTYPAAYPGVIAIGSLGRERNACGLFCGVNYNLRNAKSNTGVNIDFVAPGEAIVGAKANSKTGSVKRSGTSCASAYASGVLCLLLSFLKKNGIRLPQNQRDVQTIHYLLSTMTTGGNATEYSQNSKKGYGPIKIDIPKDVKAQKFVKDTINNTPVHWNAEFMPGVR